MIGKIATAAVYVDDQDKSIVFWVEKAGFEIPNEQSMGPNARWVEVGPPGAASCLVIYPNAMMEDWAERKPSIVFECDDLQATYEEMSGRGVAFSQPPKEMAWGGFAIFTDEDGNWYGLRERG